MERIKAKEGMYLTQIKEDVEERVYAKSICLSKNEKVDNWRDATQEEKQAYDEEQEALKKEAYERWKRENAVE